MASLTSIVSTQSFRAFNYSISNPFTVLTRSVFTGFTGCTSYTANRTLFGRQIAQIPSYALPSIHVRHISTDISVPLSNEEFFNRDREIQSFKKLLAGRPRLSIVTGPVNSGKSALLAKVIQEISQDGKRPVLHLDLRSRAFNSVNSFAASLTSGMESWLGTFKAVAERCKLTLPDLGFTLNASEINEDSKATPVDRLNALFGEMDKHLPPFDWWSGSQSPILFIDEASKLQNLLRDEEGHEALRDMFEWFVLNTKQKHRFHVVLASSDSFFHVWAEDHVGESRNRHLVVGNLTKDEALAFWNERVVTQHHLRNHQPFLDFEGAYSVCGGNMFYLLNYADEQFMSDEGKKPEDFSLVGAERRKLFRGLMSNKDHQPSHDKYIKDKLWDTEQLIKIMRAIVNAKEGFLDHEQLCDKYGRKVIKSLIEHNILHLRPGKEFSYDLESQGIEQAVVTAETPASVVAMKQLLADIDSKKLRM